MQYHISASCYEHVPIIGFSSERMDAFSGAMIQTFQDIAATVHAWCVLPNHYHALVTTEDLQAIIKSLGQLHGRLSLLWNREENAQGRHCWHRASDRAMRGEGHFWATVNYIHHNPVRHGYVEKWQEWPWSSAHEYLKDVGHDEAQARWKGFPVLNYGEGWDDPNL
jgi:putative transposase